MLLNIRKDVRNVFRVKAINLYNSALSKRFNRPHKDTYTTRERTLLQKIDRMKEIVIADLLLQH